MVVLNFSCTEKRKALEDHTCSQTIRTSVKKFCKPMQVYPILDVIERKPYTMWYPLHIWWNARNFHVEDVCECGKTLDESDNFHKGHNLWGLVCYKGKSPFHEFKLKRKGLGKSQFLGMGEITSIVKKKVSEITEEDAIADGFSEGDYLINRGGGRSLMTHLKARESCIVWLLSHNKNLTLDDFVYIIRWRWV